MAELPTRAPIPYVDIRGPYNVIRAAGALLFVVGIAIWSFQSGVTVGVLAVIPAIAVIVDALYRRKHGTSALPAEIMGTTAIGLALVLRGPDAGIHGLAIIWVLVSASLILPVRQAAGLVVYMIAWSGVSSMLFTFTDLPLVGVIEGSGAEDPIDRIAAVAFIVTTSVVMLGAIRAVLRSQDRQSEALAQERRAVQLKNEFVSMVSHELRTPLTGIAGFTDTLAESWMALSPEEVTEFLEIMRHENDHLSNLVEDILVIPRLEAGQLRLNPEEFDLAAEAHVVASMVLDVDAYSVSVPPNVIVRTDRSRLRQILRNLLENAKKYGGDDVLIDGELYAPGLYRVGVSDNGTGIDEEHRDRIFKHFEQLSTGDARLQQGVGLGLPIARKLSRAMGGDLWYEDRFPVGARFSFSVTLPNNADAADSTQTEHVHA
ncbi:MAG: HAMP domain-containing sensor histidine kinase [Actinomycetota bacterium]